MKRMRYSAMCFELEQRAEQFVKLRNQFWSMECICLQYQSYVNSLHTCMLASECVQGIPLFTIKPSDCHFYCRPVCACALFANVNSALCHIFCIRSSGDGASGLTSVVSLCLRWLWNGRNVTYSQCNWNCVCQLSCLRAKINWTLNHHECTSPEIKWEWQWQRRRRRIRHFRCAYII